MLNRQSLFNIHNNRIEELDKLNCLSEAKSGLADYRKTLISFAEGKVLETGVGTSNNLRFYRLNPQLQVTAIDYSPNALTLALQKDAKGVTIDYKLEGVEQLSHQFEFCRWGIRLSRRHFRIGVLCQPSEGYPGDEESLQEGWIDPAVGQWVAS